MGRNDTYRSACPISFTEYTSLGMSSIFRGERNGSWASDLGIQARHGLNVLDGLVDAVRAVERAGELLLRGPGLDHNGRLPERGTDLQIATAA